MIYSGLHLIPESGDCGCESCHKAVRPILSAALAPLNKVKM